jgi:hypothetical protein
MPSSSSAGTGAIDSPEKVAPESKPQIQASRSEEPAAREERDWTSPEMTSHNGSQAGGGGELYRASTAPRKGSTETGRRQQFINFYMQHDPTRAPDIAAHVDFLLENYRFEDIVESLLQKYGTVPQGWSQTSNADLESDIKHMMIKFQTSCKVQFEEHTQCSICGVDFSMFNRRHHCRHCGRSLCGKHSRRVNCQVTTSSTRNPNAPMDALNLMPHLVRLCEECIRGSRDTMRRWQVTDGYSLDLTGAEQGLLRNIIESDRKVDFLDALQVFSKKLDSVKLPESSVDFKQACKDVLREHVVLNGISFVGEGETKVNRLIAALKNTMLSTANMSMKQAETATQRILCGTSRTSSGADSYFVLHMLFERPNLLLKPRPGPLHPIQIELWGSGSRLICTVCTTNLFGLYIRNQIEGAAALPEAWVLLDTLVTENLEFDVLSPELVMPGKRVLSITSPEHSPSPSKEADELF